MTITCRGVAPATPNAVNFSGSGIVTDGDTADPLLATSSVVIAYNQVVGCVTTEGDHLYQPAEWLQMVAAPK